MLARTCFPWLVLYEMATGRAPFTGETAAVVHEGNPQPTARRSARLELRGSRAD